MFHNTLLLRPFLDSDDGSAPHMQCLYSQDLKQDQVFQEAFKAGAEIRDIILDIPIMDVTTAPLRLNQLFRVLKIVYRPFMRRKGAKLWFICRTPASMDSSNARSGIDATIAGVSALCKVAAMELGSKNVAVNALQMEGDLTPEKLKPILEWSRGEAALFMTAQHIHLKGNS